MDVTMLKQSEEQEVSVENSDKQVAPTELCAVELAYVGGGMGIHCWC